MTRPFNFSPGPAALPDPVLQHAAARNARLARHRHVGDGDEPSRQGVHVGLRPRPLALYRELLAIPDGYQVLFLQGGAIGQNAIVPMNLLRGKTRADYVNTGDWAKRSIAEAEHFCRVNVAASGEASGFTAIPPRDRVAPRPGGGVRPHLRQRDDHRPRVPLDAGYRRGAAGRRHVVEHPVAADRRQPLRPDLRRRAEEHRPGRAHAW